MSTSLRRHGPSKGDLKQEAILDTAERLLAVKPLAEIGIEELAAGAAISRSSFYFYFESKQAMLRALVARVSDVLHAEVDSWRRDGDARQEIRRGIQAAARMWREHGAVLHATRSVEASQEIKEFVAGRTSRLVEVAVAIIDKTRADGLAPAGPPSAEALGAMLVEMTEHCLAMAHARNPTTIDDELVDTLVTVWTRGIFAADGSRTSE
ncbi:MAG: TetR/AcrR family transcriptional regulator [Kutzneria sp.]|nr:TetR/AcrR family transcriptional regulator [Kutzneria sp.]